MSASVARSALPAPPASQPDRSAAIQRSILTAILEHRLPTGTKLVEDEIGAIFGVSRTVVRAALQNLAHEGLVVIERHRGAYVATPTAREAKQIYAARRIIEPTLARQAAARFRPADEERLRAHLAREAEALLAQERGVAIRLSGEFHLRIAEVADNDVLTRFLGELIARGSLVVTVYGRTSASSCGTRDHHRLVDALAAGDQDLAAAAMLHHLDHIEADIDLSGNRDAAVNLEAILSPLADGG